MTGIHGWKVSWQADLIRRKCCRAKRLRCGTLTDLLRAVAKQKERCAGAPWDTVASHPAHSGFWKVQQEQLQTHLLGFFLFLSGSRSQLVSPHDRSTCSVHREQTIPSIWLCCGTKQHFQNLTLFWKCMFDGCFWVCSGGKKKKRKKLQQMRA